MHVSALLECFDHLAEESNIVTKMVTCTTIIIPNSIYGHGCNHDHIWYYGI